MTGPSPDPAAGGGAGGGAGGDALARLAAAWIDGELDAADLAALEVRLRSDPAARRAFIDRALLDAHLADEFSAAGLVGMIDAIAGREGRETPRRASGFAAVRGLSRFAATVLVAAAVGTFAGGVATWQARAGVGGGVRGPLAEISRTRLAVPPASADGEPPQPLVRGRRLHRGRVALASGAIELSIGQAALVVLEGPAELELLAPDRAYLHRGVAVVRLPAAGEFELETATARVVGGGEFAVKVDALLTTDVQVYSGDAVVAAGTKQGGGQYPDRISAGEALRISARADAAPERLGFSERRFTRRVPDDTQGIGLAGEGAGRTGEWAAARHPAIVVQRAAGPVAIDGELDDWPARPGFRQARQGRAAEAEQLEGWMMFDDERLYVAARVRDPLPLRNSVDPELDAGLVWQGGGLQIFFSGDRAAGWPADANGPSYYANRQLPTTSAERVKADNPRLMTLIMTHHAPSGVDRLFLGRTVVDYRPETIGPDAYAGRFRRSPDGRGYTLEYAIPWETLGLADDPPRSGDTLAVAWQLHFSEETGKLWRDQIVEIRNPAEPAGIWPFERAATWGRAEFRDPDGP
jgi:hypothetical protein